MQVMAVSPTHEPEDVMRTLWTTQQWDCKIRPSTTHSQSTHTAWSKHPAKLHAHGHVLNVPCLKDFGFVCWCC